ncbi:MAG TPA: hypothetical protein VF815_15400 [Myxococcaceae bacterium]
MNTRIVVSSLLSLSLASCGVRSDAELERQPLEAVSESQELSDHGPQLVQAGSAQQLLAVTSDNYVLYQEGTRVFASALTPGAQKQQVAEVPAGNLAFVYSSGKVAFCWTNPDRTRPGFGVSPLVVWSAATGPHLADSASPIGTFATAASSDGTSVVYPARSSADQTTGDLELASTDLSRRTTLAAGIPMGFPFGFCRPWAAFSGDGNGSQPVALFCQPGDRTGTLASWRGSTRTDLLTGAATPPFFTADESGTSFFTTLAATATTPATAVVVSKGRAPVVVDQNVARTGFIMHDDTVVYISRADGRVSLKRFDPNTGARTTISETLFNFLTPLAGSDLVTKPWFSQDRKKVSYSTVVSSNGFGLVDQSWADLRGETQSFVADSQPRNWSGVPTFTGDSKHFLFSRSTDAWNGLGAFFAQSEEGPARQYSDDKGWNYLAASGTHVSFIDNFDLVTFTGDLKAVDVSRDTLDPRRIATGVDANYLASPDGRLVIYTKNLPGATAGLYVARVAKNRLGPEMQALPPSPE